MSSDFEAINYSAYSPRPGGVLSRIVESASAGSGAQLRVKQVKRVSGMVDLLSCGILCYVVMDEVDGCDGPTRKDGRWETTCIDSTTWSERHNDQRRQRAAPRWKVNVRSQPKRSVVPGHNHCQ